MLGGRFGFVYRPLDAYRLGFDERCAKTFEFLRRQVTLACRFGKFIDRARGIMMASREQAALLAEREHCRECRQGAVRHDGMAFTDLAMKLGDRRPADGVGALPADVRGDVSIEVAPIEFERRRLAL